MKPSNRYIIIILGIFLSNISIAQKNSKVPKAQAAYLSAFNLLSVQNIPAAIDNLIIAIQLDPTFATAHQQLGDLYRKTDNFKAAINHYKQVLQIDPNLTPLTKFGLGEALLNEGHCKEALTHLMDYSTYPLSDQSKRKVIKLIEDCKFSLNIKKDNNLIIKKVSNNINTINDEYFPKLTADNDRIIFTRKVNNQENFFESTLQNNNWTTAKKLIGQINSDKYNEGAHCISPDGKYLFFTGCNRPNGFGSCDIYVSKFENGVWSAPHNLGEPINTKGWESQPAISADGRTLYFVSNRAGGMGGYDIWKSNLGPDGTWQPPINLGKNINTTFDESAPYIHADNQTLYFASNGWPGFGQLDLFKSSIDSLGQWSIPENLGAPINNHYNQTAMHVSIDGKLGFISAQDSTKQLDIYTFDMPALIQPLPIAYIVGEVVDAQSQAPIAAHITVTNTINNQIIFDDLADSYDGRFVATLPIGENYAIHITKKGYMFQSLQYDLHNAAHKNQRFESKIELQAIHTGHYTILNNIYFETNQYELLPTSKQELEILLTFLKENTNLSIELGGHTDNTGNKKNNEDLSLLRAQSVVNYLLQHGISQNRLKAKGYGDTKPIANNNTGEGRQLNRRTEFTILP